MRTRAKEEARAMFSVLRNRTYRHLFAAQVIALVGTGLATVALSLLAYDLAGGNASAVLGTALAVKMVAYVGIAPVIGALGDRIPRRALLVAADLVRGVVALALPFVTEVWQIYVLIFFLQSASAAFTPTFQATIPEVLPAERDYTRALSLSRLAYDMESLFSPVLAAGLLTLLTYDRLFLGTAAGFAASAALVVSVALPKPVPREGGGEGGTESGGVFARAAYGMKLFGSAPQLRALLALNLAVAAASSMVIVNTVVLVRDHFARPVGDVSLALGAYGAGSMAVALALPRVLERAGDRAVMLPAAFVPAPVLAVVGTGRRGGGEDLAGAARGVGRARRGDLGDGDAGGAGDPRRGAGEGGPAGGVRGAVLAVARRVAGDVPAGRLSRGTGRDGGGGGRAGGHRARGGGGGGAAVAAGGRGAYGRALPAGPRRAAHPGPYDHRGVTPSNRPA
ncbi:MFS transporter [Streptomyces sp. CNQ-509]|uniref:MFS transporter n=1 Tax=Streptomyces sp. CNQ-509 TaxID=444103 RepID=UPI0020A627BF|nr:MFS transporter [Streptomyces sp. CNQ-509]